MNAFLTSNDWKWRLARTVCQGLVGVLIANIDLLVGYVVLDTAMRPVAAAAVMAVLSPVMAMLGGGADGDAGGGDGDVDDEEDDDVPLRAKHAYA